VRRHELDLFSLIAGLMFLVLAAGFVVDEAVTDVNVDGRWVIPVLLVGIGVASLAGLVRGRRDDDSGREIEEPSADGPGPREG
jgi:hypothetical protein